MRGDLIVRAEYARRALGAVVRYEGDPLRSSVPLRDAFRACAAALVKDLDVNPEELVDIIATLDRGVEPIRRDRERDGGAGA
jgi:hypothetical protein